ncbi:translation initiation factor IF-5A [Candidatus Woesearchaeota archaeon]|nr:translation initiation factor IF-5A [Candidatus Woesearchaeota archaeon]
MTTRSVGANTLKEGSFLVMEGAACRVTNIQISRPGKHGHAKMRIEGMGIIDDKKRIVVMPGHDSVDVPVIEKRTAQVLSVQGSSANVMDIETYETFDLKIPEDMKADCQPGTNVLYWQVLNDKVMKQVKAAE